MGAVCCVAAKDRTITNGSPVESLQRQIRYSPTWSFRWDNRGRVAGEETHANWDGGCATDRAELKSSTTVEAAFSSEDGGPLDSSQSVPWQKSPPSEGNTGFLRLPSIDQAIQQTTVEVKEPTDSPSVSYPSPLKLSPSVPSVSSASVSPLSSHSHMPPPSSTPSRWHHCSPGHRLLRQTSDTDIQIPEYKSRKFSISEEPPVHLPPGWGNESSRGSNGGSSDSWSIPGFSELMTNRRESWSFDSEASGFSHDKITRSSRGNSGSFSTVLQTCGICRNLLTERSVWMWNTHKIMPASELDAVSVLTCGHVYHAECLESMTPENHKYDPACPVCTLGEKCVIKMSEKALKAGLDSKARKRSRKRVVDSDFMFDRHKSGLDGKGPKMGSSSSLKIGGKNLFLKRHFSFGSKASRSMTENLSSLKKGFFWTRSSKN